MTDYVARPGRDGQFYVHTPGDRELAGPYPTLEAAARHGRTLTRDRWLLVTVERTERSASPWDAYVKLFRHAGDGRSAEERLLDWWLALPDNAYTRTRAHVRVFDITGREWHLLAPADARSVLDSLAPEPADPALAVSFAPDAIRAHFEGTDRQQQAGALPDRALEDAARNVALSSDRLRALVSELCLDVLGRASAEADAGRG